MSNHDSWIIDGNGSQYAYERRMVEADAIILVTLPRLVCLWHVIKRYIKYHGRVREDTAENCQEKLDIDFIKWVALTSRTQKFLDTRSTYPHKLIVLKSKKQIKNFLTTFYLRISSL